MNISDTKTANCKCTSYKTILTLFGIGTSLFFAGTIYFLIKTYNQNKLISEQLSEYANQFEIAKNQNLSFDDNLELKMRKLLDEVDLAPKRLLFDPSDFFDYQTRINKFYRLSSSSIKMLDNEYLITLAVPGFSKEQIKIDLNDSILTILAENSQKSEDEDDKKNTSSKFKQVIRLGNDIERDSIKSSLKDGILTITIPRLQQKSESKTITIE